MNWIEAAKTNPPKSKLESDKKLGYSVKVLVRVVHADGREAGYSFAKMVIRSEHQMWMIESFSGQGWKVSHWCFIIDPITKRIVQ